MAIDTERGRAGLLDRRTGGGVVARLTTETKHAFKTTEFWAMVAVIAGILIASAVVDDAEGAGAAGDAFSAQRAWLYVAIVAVGYMVRRGLAKAGSREPYWAGPFDLPGRDPDDRRLRRSVTTPEGRAARPALARSQASRRRRVQRKGGNGARRAASAVPPLPLRLSARNGRRRNQRRHAGDDSASRPPAAATGRAPGRRKEVLPARRHPHARPSPVQ